MTYHKEVHEKCMLLAEGDAFYQDIANEFSIDLLVEAITWWNGEVLKNFETERTK